jgi:2-phospho-L-lactate/phosphoenolpyruvate guanylyltransferase
MDANNPLNHLFEFRGGGSVGVVTYIRAFVPLKHPACARRRMLDALTAKQRHSMYFTMARRVITALRDVPMVRDTVIVTSSAEVEIFAGHLGVRVMHQMRDEGINCACEAALASSSAVGITNALILSGDLPLVTSESITALLQSAVLQQRGVTIVPDRRRLGTNALVCTPTDAIRLQYGSNSFADHVRTAREHGLVTRVFESGELALDIDEPEDLDAWREYDTPTNVGDQRESTSTAGGRVSLSGNRIDALRPGSQAG